MLANIPTMLAHLIDSQSPKHRIIKAIFICVYSGVYWPLMPNYCSLLYGICLIALCLYFTVHLWALCELYEPFSVVFLGGVWCLSCSWELLGIFQVFLMFFGGGILCIFDISANLRLFKGFMVFQLFYRDFWYVFIRLWVIHEISEPFCYFYLFNNFHGSFGGLRMSFLRLW